MRIVLAGGGTAGHIEPALAIAAELETTLLSKKNDIHFVGGFRGLESRLVPNRGYQLHQIDIVGLPRKINLTLFQYPLRLWRAKNALVKLFQEIKPDLLLGFGGYVAAPSYLAARKLNIPIVIHEANAQPGVANRKAAKFATLVIDSFAGSISNAVTLGVPVRSELRNLNRLEKQAEARDYFGFPRQGKVLLVFGGSQGAEQINKAVSEISDQLLEEHINVLHIVGDLNLDRYLSKTGSNDARYKVIGYCERMDLAYSAADLAITRSGALTVAELACVGLPAILVPYPVGNGEQEKNAAELVAVGAAQLVLNSDCTGKLMLSRIKPLLSNSELLIRMSDQAKSIARPTAAKDIVSHLNKLVQK